MKKFTKKSNALTEEEYKNIKNLLTIANVRKVADFTGWRKGTIYLVNRASTWGEYLAHKEVVAKRNRERWHSLPAEETVTTPESRDDIALISRAEYNGLVKSVEDMSKLLLNIAKVEQKNSEFLELLVTKKSKQLKEIFGF